MTNRDENQPPSERMNEETRLAPQYAEDIENGNARLENDDEVKPLTKESNGNEEQVVLQAAFAIFDKDCDGLLSRTEMKTGLRELGATISETLLDAMFDEADKDKDGGINFKEFCKSVSS